MRVAFRRQHPSHTNGRVPDFLVSELKAAGWEQTGDEVQTELAPSIVHCWDECITSSGASRSKLICPNFICCRCVVRDPAATTLVLITDHLLRSQSTFTLGLLSRVVLHVFVRPGIHVKSSHPSSYGVVRAVLQ